MTRGQLKVLDFGLTGIETPETATQLTVAGSTVGTAAYMSPEQAAGESVDARSVLWSLLFGEHPSAALEATRSCRPNRTAFAARESGGGHRCLAIGGASGSFTIRQRAD
jgi:serine/threonine protein kinase